MKIAEYNQMMAYLTRPEPKVLPQPKPQELLDIQEQNKIERQQETMDKASPFLMDESVDFIERENFSIAGLVETKPFFNQYTGKNFSQTEINRIKKFGVEKYKKLNAAQRAAIRRGDPGKGFMTEEKMAERAKRLRPVFKGKGSKKGETPKVVDVSGPKELKAEYIDDFKKRLKYPKAGGAFRKAVEEGEILSNPQLAKKYEMTLSDVERLNMFFTEQEGLKYEKGTPGSGQELRKRRLQLNQPGTYISGKGKIQFHHIMPIGGDVDLTSKDVAFINKYVNASLQKYNTPLNRIADGISDNLAKYSETKDTAFLKRIDDLNTQAAQIVDKTKKELPKKIQGLIGFNKITPVLDENATLINTTVERIGIDEAKTAVGKKGPTVKLSDMSSGTYTPLKFQKEAGKVAKKLTSNDSKNIAKQLASFGFKCSAAEGGACDNPMAYLDDIKKQQTIAKGSGNAAANAAKKLSAGKTIMREFIGPAALGFELAAAVPITYLGYKSGLPPERIVADATYGLFGDTEKARLKKEAVKAGIDTTEIQKSLDFEKASQAMQTLAQQEGEFRGPDDEMLFPQQYEKGEEDFYKAVGAFRDKAGNVSKDVYKKFGSQLQQLRDYIAQTDADTAAERSSKVADFGGIADYINYNSGGRVNYSNGSDGTDLAIKESLEAFERYLKAGGKLSYKDFIAVGGEGVSKFFNAGGRVGFADGPDNPKRRQFMKIMAGIASLPIVGKFFKGAKTAKVVKLANTTTKMPDWFPAFVDNAFKKGIAKKIDADLTEIEIPELPDVKVLAHDDGRIQVEGKNAYNEEYYIDYEPPEYVVVDETTGKAVKKPGDFVATDTEYRMISPEDYDIDGVNVDEIDDILGGSSTKLEGFAKGTNKEKYTIGQKRIDEADARGASKDESLRADINDPYGDIDPTDFTDD